MQHLSTKDDNSLRKNHFAELTTKQGQLRIVSTNGEAFHATANNRIEPDYTNFELDGEPHQKTKVETAFEIAGEVCLALAIGSILILAIHHGADVVAQFSPNAY
ncbi:MAG: hypothetical protein ACU0AU_05015 [Cognatishimia activa]